MSRAGSAGRLSVGRLSFLLEGADVRYLAVDGVEIVRRVYVTVRDAAWEMPELRLVRAAVEESTAAIEVRAAGSHVSSALEVEWKVTIHAFATGEFSYEVALDPRVAFPYARMGICVLHPPESLCGGRFVATSPNGETAGEFERPIAVQMVRGGEILPLVPAFSRLLIKGAEGSSTDFQFEGDLFEMEDQRNWSDGSFKTYCTPLAAPLPQRAEPGHPISQRIVLTPGRPSPTLRPAGRAEGQPVAIDVATPTAVAVVPSLGLSLGDPVAPDQERMLREIGLEHIRVDLRDPRRAADRLSSAAALANAVGAGLVPAVFPGSDEDLAALGELLAPYADEIVRLLVFSDAEPSSTGPLVAGARHQLGGILRRARFVGGTDVWFAELNRGRPDPEAMDGVAWSITPQVHALDDLSLIEALTPQAEQVETARAFAPGLELVVGPVTLRPRYNPHAVDARAQAIEPPPESIDPRQGELLAAAWTAASLAQLAAAKADAITYYETAGPRGVLAAEGAGVLPCWHPLADAGTWAGWEVLETTPADPLAVQALAVREPGGAGLGLLVANLRNEPTPVRIAGLGGGSARVRVLDARTRAVAGAEPNVFRASGAEQPLEDGALRLSLGPHAVATIEVEGSRHGE